MVGIGAKINGNGKSPQSAKEITLRGVTAKMGKNGASHISKLYRGVRVSLS
jgi:hypothetical protein